MPCWLALVKPDKLLIEGSEADEVALALHHLLALPYHIRSRGFVVAIQDVEAEDGVGHVLVEDGDGNVIEGTGEAGPYPEFPSGEDTIQSSVMLFGGRVDVVVVDLGEDDAGHETFLLLLPQGGYGVQVRGAADEHHVLAKDLSPVLCEVPLRAVGASDKRGEYDAVRLVAGVGKLALQPCPHRTHRQ